jgi:hypothetical protein
MQKRNWNESKFGKMTFENVCRFYSSDKSVEFKDEPPCTRAFYAKNGSKQYAVRWNKYQANVKFSGGNNGSDYFVSSGKCEIIIDGRTYQLQSGECFEFPKCKYQFKAIGDEVFEYVTVYKLPDDFTIN